MAKQRRVVKVVRTPKPKKKIVVRKRKPTAPKTTARPAARKLAAAPRKPAPKKKGPLASSRRRADASPPPVTPPPVVPRKPGFYEAVAIYERGVQALQRHDYAAAAGFFRIVLERYPDERELIERARLYLRVCERETARQAAPKTPAERVYAATVALNSGDHSGAIDHLRRALGEDPESDHAHYIMAVTLGMRSRTIEALDHLRHAIRLNPENRAIAIQDPDLGALRVHETFRSVLDTPVAPGKRRPRPK